MKRIALLLFAAFGIAAHADQITVIPQIPIDCMQPQLEDVSFLNVMSATDGAVSLQLTYGSCQLGNVNLDTIGNNNNIYVIDQEYSSDFNDTESYSGNTMNIQLTYTPSIFFAGYQARHFVVSFYPSGASLSFGWNLTFTKDASGTTTLSVDRL
jgi:hypothetical protein